jgi:DNA recombination protein RmuC
VIEALAAAAAGMGLGLIVGMLGASWHHRRQSQSLHVELAILNAQLKTQEQIEREQQASQDRSMEQLRSAFIDVADASLRSNSELFLRLAREHLGQHQQSSLAALSEREQAIATMLAPIREALGKTEQQILRIEKERAETFGSLKSSLESVALGQQALQRETRTLVNALRRPEVRGQWGEMT